MEIDAVEIDPEVIQDGQDSFQRPRRQKSSTPRPGRTAVFDAELQNQYDIILLDAYFTDAMPFHLATKEFFELAQKKLTPNGIIVANLISAVTGPSGKIARAFVKTQRQIFPQTYVFAARRPDNVSVDTIQNVIVIATRTSSASTSRRSSNAPLPSTRGFFPILSRTSAWLITTARYPTRRPGIDR